MQALKTVQKKGMDEYMKGRPMRAMVNHAIMERKTAEAVPIWRIADELGVCEGTMQRRLRHQLPPDQEAEVLQAIERAAEKMRAERSTGI